MLEGKKNSMTIKLKSVFCSFLFEHYLHEFVDYRLFKQYLILILVNQMASGLFRFVAVVGRDLVVANTTAAFTLLIVIVLGGFILLHGKPRKFVEFCFHFVF